MAKLQYLLMSVILMSSLIAMLLQYMAAKLELLVKWDLVQAIERERVKIRESFYGF